MQNITKIGLLFGVTFVLAIFLTKNLQKIKTQKRTNVTRTKNAKKNIYGIALTRSPFLSLFEV